MLVAVLAAPTRPALADELQVTVACPAWSSEAAAQVEARIRTSFLAASLGARRVAVSCAADATSVEVEAEQGTLLRPVVPRSGVLEDDVVATAEAALHELTDSPPAPAPPEPPASPAPSLAPPAEAPPPPAPARPEPPPTVAPATEPVPPATLWQGQAGLLLERWDAHWAVGGEAAISAGSRAFGYGFALGGRAALGEPAAFTVNEWSLSARLRLTPRQLAGLRGSLGFGVSLLVASPAAGVTADSPTQVGAAYLELRVSRPFSLGWLALAPSLGARVFSARRDVSVNTQEWLVVPRIVPEAALWLLAPGD